MEAIRTIQDFKDFMNANYNNIYSNARLEGLNITFPQMKEDEWEAVYQQEEKNNGKV